MRRRAIFAAAVSALVAGCASQQYADPDRLVLQDPLPGQALIYLLRVPKDPLPLVVRVGGRVAAHLPSESYTALSIGAGEHTIETVALKDGTRPVTPSFTIRLQPEDRVFLVISGRSDRPNPQLQAIDAALKLRYYVFTPMPTAVVEGSRTWKLYQEADARPLLTILSLSLPERQ